MSPFAGYLLGLFVLVGGLAVAAYLLNVPTTAVIVALILAVGGILAWATRRRRAQPSAFTGTTPNSPSLDRTVLMELKTTLMERPDANRTEPTTRIERQTEVSKQQKSPPRDN